MDGIFSCPPVCTASILQMEHLKGLNLADVETHDVKILIGANIPKAHIQLEIREGQGSEPVAIKTSLGWCIMGTSSQEWSSAYVNLCTMTHENLSQQIERFWQTEAFGVSVNLEESRSVEDLRSLKVLEDQSTFVDGHYQVPMLWKEQCSTS